jgi:hypothetical protein
MHCGRDTDEVFLFGVPVEARDGAQPPRDRRPSASQAFEVAGEGLDIGSARTEQ